MNNRKIFARQNAAELKIINAYGDPGQMSGIYVFTRKDEEKDKISAYIGQAKNLRRRIAQHLLEYDHIGLSLKKHGLYDEKKNPQGWHCEWKYCKIEELDAEERRTIASFKEIDIYELYNITSGGQGKGKVDIAPRAERKGYYKGKQDGFDKAIKEIGMLITKYTTGLCSKGGAIADRKTAELKELLNIK